MVPHHNNNIKGLLNNSRTNTISKEITNINRLQIINSNKHKPKKTKINKQAKVDILYQVRHKEMLYIVVSLFAIIIEVSYKNIKMIFDRVLILLQQAIFF